MSVGECIRRIEAALAGFKELDTAEQDVVIAHFGLAPLQTDWRQLL